MSPRIRGRLRHIVIPVTVAAILAAVLSPLVGYLERRRVSRAAGSVLVFVLTVVLGLAFGVLILTGISSQSGSLTGHLQDASDEIQGWLEDLGVNAHTARSAKDDASSSVSDGFRALIDGLETGISALASLAVFLAFTALSLFFLVKDGPRIRAWGERHLGVPEAVASTIVDRTAGALRGSPCEKTGHVRRLPSKKCLQTGRNSVPGDLRVIPGYCVAVDLW